MNFTFKSKDSKGELEFFTSKNKSKLSNITPKRALLQIIISLLLLLRIVILKMK